ncbi:hypothetical protein DVDV_3182 [Desulfovibrio sp. DV]|nr:hypothetical protein DVDV_3182 [Desulfovibrio sp. DV]
MPRPRDPLTPRQTRLRISFSRLRGTGPKKCGPLEKISPF